MNTEINKTKWKCRRGLRELDLLFRKYSENSLESLSKEDFEMFNSILDIEDQPLYDFISVSYTHLTLPTKRNV